MNNLSPVRQNLLEDRHYTPYCGNDSCKIMPRTEKRPNRWDFFCRSCGWESKLPQDFQEQLDDKWSPTRNPRK